MKESNLKFQASLFGSFEDISPTTDNLKYALNEFEYLGLIPSSYDQIEIPQGLSQLLGGSGQGIPRFNLKSGDGLWLIDFEKNRIDIIKQTLDTDLKGFGDLADFLIEANRILEKVQIRFNKTFHRLSIITRHLFSDLTEDQFSAAFTSLVNPVAIYQENPPTEWQTRLLSKISPKDYGELLNVICAANRGTVAMKAGEALNPVDGIEVLFDINTHQSNTEYRFGTADIPTFWDVAATFTQSILDEYRGRFN